MADQKAQSSKGRKIGRSARSPSKSRYNSTRRDLINKARKIAKHERLHVGKVLAVPRGTARKNNRLFTGITRSLS